MPLLLLPHRRQCMSRAGSCTASQPRPWRPTRPTAGSRRGDHNGVRSRLALTRPGATCNPASVVSDRRRGGECADGRNGRRGFRCSHSGRRCRRLWAHEPSDRLRLSRGRNPRPHGASPLWHTDPSRADPRRLGWCSTCARSRDCVSRTVPAPGPAPRSHSRDDRSAPFRPRGPAISPRQAPPTIHVEDWQAWIADGFGIVTNGMLCVTGPELTADEWTARP